MVPPDTTTAINKYLADADPQQTIGKLLKFSKGEFLKGQDLEPVPAGTVFAAACDMALRGYIRWADNKPAEHRLVRIASGAPMPRREDLGHHDKSQWEKDLKDEPRDPWGECMYLPLMAEDGELATFTTSSKSGIKSLNRLLRRYAIHAARHPDDYPVVKLKADFFMHSDRAIGKVFFPDFEPAGYVNRAEFLEALEAVGVLVETPVAALPSPKDEMNDSLEF